MGFVVALLCYLLAFVTGSAVAWGVTVVTIKATSEEDALAALAAGTGTR